jgi:putative acetyltransferase
MSEPIATIRLEVPSDREGIRQVHLDAFGRHAEADLVEALRRQGGIAISLVAEAQGQLVGNAVLVPVAVGLTAHGLKILALGPIAVLTGFQFQGIGSLLVGRAIEEGRAQGWPAIVVHGSPEYFQPFGFVEASRFGLRCEFGAPAAGFMAMELRPAAFRGWSGLVRYPQEFSSF